MESWTLYYDGGCNLCHASQLRIEKWAARAGQPLVVDILQSDAAIAKGYTMEGMVLEVDGKALIGYEAWLHSMRVAPVGLCWLYWFRNLPVFRPLMKWVYSVVAKYRLRWFGTRSCPIPTQKVS
jgi:predicted DCC family thiol-disulfide oxidoreductase YuxK